MGDLTHVELLWIERSVERWIRFGRPVGDTILGRRRRVLDFATGSIFALVRWAGNDSGTIASRVDILRAVRRGEASATVPHVDPGADILLRVAGWPKVRSVLNLIGEIESLGIDAADAAPDYWRHVHGRLIVGEAVRPYTRERHKAWLLRRRLS
jgi:Protein of unknown function (DUF2840)